jgi:hypothetical protein
MGVRRKGRSEVPASDSLILMNAMHRCTGAASGVACVTTALGQRRLLWRAACSSSQPLERRHCAAEPMAPPQDLCCSLA